MKIQCSVCEAAEAKVLCCADEAALCWGCDEKVHAANKLASKHQRVLLSTPSTSSHTPKCDICQEIEGCFFCLEDRALLCRKCDDAIHSTNALVSSHQRFLLTGVKVGPEARPSSSMICKTPSDARIPGPDSRSVVKPTAPMSSCVVVSEFTPSRLSFAGGSAAAGNVTQWPIDEFLKFGDSNQKAKLGDSIPSRPVEGVLETNKCLDQMPDTFWAVPQITSHLTESELQLSKSCQNPLNCSTFVSSPWFQISRPHQEPRGTSSKRRRQF